VNKVPGSVVVTAGVSLIGCSAACCPQISFASGPTTALGVISATDGGRCEDGLLMWGKTPEWGDSQDIPPASVVSHSGTATFTLPNHLYNQYIVALDAGGSLNWCAAVDVGAADVGVAGMSVYGDSVFITGTHSAWHWATGRWCRCGNHFFVCLVLVHRSDAMPCTTGNSVNARVVFWSASTGSKAFVTSRTTTDHSFLVRCALCVCVHVTMAHPTLVAWPACLLACVSCVVWLVTCLWWAVCCASCEWCPSVGTDLGS